MADLHGAGLVVVAVSEVWKLVLRHREAPAERAADEPVDDHDMAVAPAEAAARFVAGRAPGERPDTRDAVQAAPPIAPSSAQSSPAADRTCG